MFLTPESKASYPRVFTLQVCQRLRSVSSVAVLSGVLSSTSSTSLASHACHAPAHGPAFARHTASLRQVNTFAVSWLVFDPLAILLQNVQHKKHHGWPSPHVICNSARVGGWRDRRVEEEMRKSGERVERDGVEQRGVSEEG